MLVKGVVLNCFSWIHCFSCLFWSLSIKPKCEFQRFSYDICFLSLEIVRKSPPSGRRKIHLLAGAMPTGPGTELKPWGLSINRWERKIFPKCVKRDQRARKTEFLSICENSMLWCWIKTRIGIYIILSNLWTLFSFAMSHLSQWESSKSGIIIPIF